MVRTKKKRKQIENKKVRRDRKKERERENIK